MPIETQQLPGSTSTATDERGDSPKREEGEEADGKLVQERDQFYYLIALIAKLKLENDGLRKEIQELERLLFQPRWWNLWGRLY